MKKIGKISIDDTCFFKSDPLHVMKDRRIGTLCKDLSDFAPIVLINNHTKKVDVPDAEYITEEDLINSDNIFLHMGPDKEFNDSLSIETIDFIDGDSFYLLFRNVTHWYLNKRSVTYDLYNRNSEYFRPEILFKDDETETVKLFGTHEDLKEFWVNFKETNIDEFSNWTEPIEKMNSKYFRVSV